MYHSMCTPIIVLSNRIKNVLVFVSETLFTHLNRKKNVPNKTEIQNLTVLFV